jgi:hypothetical protein
VTHTVSEVAHTVSEVAHTVCGWRTPIRRQVENGD